MGGGEAAQIIDGPLQPPVRLKQVEAADDSGDFFGVKHLFRLLHDVADSAVGAAGDDENPFPCADRHGGVVQQKVVHSPAVHVHFPQLPPGLKVVGLRDLPEKTAVFRDPVRLAGQGTGEFFHNLSGVKGGADVALVGPFGREAERVGDETDFGKIEAFRQGFQPAGVVVVSVGQDDVGDRSQVYPHVLCVFDENV